jgi:Domain of unknown function (DUF4062)
MAYKAFVSSTFEDLKEHRREVISALRRAGIFVDPMEDWTASSDEPKKFSQSRIKDCDLCVLIVSFRRGHVPQGEESSITELEYKAALSSGIDVLVFMLNEESPWQRKFDELEKDPGIRQLRSELKECKGVGFFGLEPNSIEIAPALTRWISEKQKPNPTERIKSVVYYAQEIVLRAFGGEYVVLREENGRKRLKACEKDIRQAQRFLILDFKNPNGRPNWPLEFGNQIVLQPIDDKNRFVSACEDLPPNFPLCVWGSRAHNWERFTLKRPDSDEARASDKTVRFRYTARFQCHSGKWVWTNYNHTDNALDGNVTTEPDRYENFTLEEPSH